MDLLEQAKKERQELLRKVAVLEDFIKSYSGMDSVSIKSEPTDNSAVTGVAPKTDSVTWDDYVIGVLKYVGEPTKTKELLTLMVNSNPDLPEKNVKRQTSGTLAKLGREGKVKSTRLGTSPKQGAIYELIA